MSNDKKYDMLNHLKNNIYCRIGVSKISGVGVIAIKDIPPNTNPFSTFKKRKINIIELAKDELITNGISNDIISLVNDFYGDNGIYYVNEYGPNDINVSYYMNHSENNNIDLIDDGSEYYGFISNQFISKGSELCINYKHYKEDKYRKS
jgi:hypothetical protein